MDDQGIAKAVHGAVDALNQALGVAADGGLSVELDVVDRSIRSDGVQRIMVVPRIERRIKVAP